MNISRQEQDQYGIESYKRAAKAIKDGVFKTQIIPVSIPQKKGKPDLVITEDEEYKRVDFDKFTKLATVFQREGGTVSINFLVYLI